MATKHDLEEWIVAALKSLGGAGNIPAICKHIWDHHESELRASGDLFYTWGYEVRWAGQRLQDRNVLEKGLVRRGIWSLK